MAGRYVLNASWRRHGISRHIKNNDEGFVGLLISNVLYTPCFFPIRQCQFRSKWAVCLYDVQRVFIACHTHPRILDGEETAVRRNMKEIWSHLQEVYIHMKCRIPSPWSDLGFTLFFTYIPVNFKPRAIRSTEWSREKSFAGLKGPNIKVQLKHH
jgi:hypothetical protein